jgi:uncharacterized protein YndB with AHSA1/START domain
MLVTMSVDIEAPPEAVWPYLVEPEKTMAWFTALKKYEWNSDERGVGAEFYWFEEASGRQYNIRFVTTEWEPHRVFGYRMTEGDFFKSYDERWVIDPTPSGSRFTFNDHIEFPYGPFGKLIGWFAARSARETGGEVLANLKRLVEDDVAGR